MCQSAPRARPECAQSVPRMCSECVRRPSQVFKSVEGFGDFLATLANPRAGDIGLIAEVKKASPSKGIIRADFDPVGIAREYEQAGASCLSVLTDREFFQGSPEFLKSIRGTVDIPLLRKDFMIDERQIVEAVEWGADAVLLIVACLDDERLCRFHELAVGCGLARLFAVADHRCDQCGRCRVMVGRMPPARLPGWW